MNHRHYLAALALAAASMLSAPAFADHHDKQDPKAHRQDMREKHEHMKEACKGGDKEACGKIERWKEHHDAVKEHRPEHREHKMEKQQ